MTTLTFSNLLNLVTNQNSFEMLHDDENNSNFKYNLIESNILEVLYINNDGVKTKESKTFNLK